MEKNKMNYYILTCVPVDLPKLKKNNPEELLSSLKEGNFYSSQGPKIHDLNINKEFIGGCDIVKEMYENGELKKIFEDKNINYKK